MKRTGRLRLEVLRNLVDVEEHSANHLALADDLHEKLTHLVAVEHIRGATNTDNLGLDLLPSVHTHDVLKLLHDDLES